MTTNAETLAARFHAVAAGCGASPAIHDGEVEWSYARLAEAVGGLAARIAAEAPAPGARIGVACPNGADFVTAFFAILSTGGVVVPVNPALKERELAAIMRDAGVSNVLTTRDLRIRCEAALRAAGHTRGYAVMAIDAARGPRGAGPPSVAVGGPAVCLYSSGSTGRPKRVERTHANLLWEVDRLIPALGLQPGDHVLGVTPFSHVNGLMRSMAAALLAGATLVSLPQFERGAVARAIAEQRISLFIGVPFMFSMLAETRWPRPPDFSSLRLCLSASAPLLPDASRRFHDRYGVYVRQLYGTTETGSIAANLDARVEDGLSTVGTPLPGVEVRILSEGGAPVADGGRGEIAVRSPASAQEYGGCPEETRHAFAGGWFRTGDIGGWDARGRLYLVGRKSLFINRAGYKVNPYEVEEVLARHPKVREVVVMGFATEYGDEKVRAVLVVREPCAARDIVEFCRGRLADFKVPSVVDFREALPKSSTGKILRAEI